MSVSRDGRPLPRGPRIPAGALVRTGLLARLDGAWDLAVVHGPSGSGKSVLLAQWARTRSEPVVWVNAARAHDLASAFDVHFEGTVIVDGADALSDDEVDQLGEALCRATGLRLVIAARGRAVVARVVQATEGTILVLDAHALRVDADEFAALAPGASRQRRAAVLADSGGLMVGVEAGLRGEEPLSQLRLRRRLLASAGHRPPGYTDALALLVLVRDLNVDTATRIGFPPDWLTLAEEDGLGFYDGDWFGVTRFAAAALAPLAEELPLDRRQTLQRAALRGLLREERPLEAMRIAVALGDLDLATEIVMPNAPAFLSDNRGSVDALSIVPVSGIEQHPVLMLLLAQALNVDSSTRIRGVQLLTRVAYRMLAPSSARADAVTVFFRAAAATILRVTPLADRALPRALRANDAVEALDWDGEERYAVTLAYLRTHLGLTGLYGADNEFAEKMFERAYADLRTRARPEAVDPLSLWAAQQAMAGSMPRAAELAAQAESARWPRGWRRALQGQGLDLAQAILALEEGDLTRCREHLLAHGPIEDLLEHWPVFAAVQAFRDVAAGDAIGGRERIREIRRARSRSSTTSVARSWLDCAESLLALLGGDPTGARRLATSAARRSVEGRIALLRVNAASGRTAEVLAGVRDLQGGTKLTSRQRMEVDTVAAAMASRGGHPADVDQILERLRAAADLTGLSTPFLALDEGDRAALILRAGQIGAEQLAERLVMSRPEGQQPIHVLQPLTEREQAVLRALFDVSSVADLAERLHVARNTVKSQLRALYRKLGAHSREEALLRATALGLLDVSAADLRWHPADER